MNGHSFPQQKDAGYESLMIRKYDKLVHKICHRYENLMPYEDMYQEALIGLLYAIRWYDESKKVPFEKTAALLIRSYIMKAYYREQKIHIPQSIIISEGIGDLVDFAEYEDLDLMELDDFDLRANVIYTASAILDKKEFDSCILTEWEYYRKYKAKDYEEQRANAIAKLKKEYDV
jgi:DNA-directed RNA polymerase specialized sigma24 family protein